MRIGMVGLGRMGGGMAERLRSAGHEVVGYDLDPALSTVSSLEGVAASLPPPRIAWLMPPAGAPTAAAVSALGAMLSPGDILVESGNNRWRDSVARGELLASRGIQFVDVGTSG